MSVHSLESACACAASTDSMTHTSVCMCKCCKAVNKQLHQGLSSMLLRHLEATGPAAYLLLCEFALNVRQNAASVLSVFCQA